MATKAALSGHKISDEIRSKVALQIGKDADDNIHTIFELLIPGDRPEDAVFISRVWVHDRTGEARVEVDL